MAISEHLRELRRRIGPALLVLPSVAAVIRDDDGAVLLVHDASTRRWVTPGGSVDPDERPADALVREVWEETGLHVEPVRLLGVHGGPEYRVRYGNGDQVSYVLAAFACVVRGGTLRADGDETLEVAWVAPSAVADLPRPPWLDDVLQADGADAGGRGFVAPTWRPDVR